MTCPPTTPTITLLRHVEPKVLVVASSNDGDDAQYLRAALRRACRSRASTWRRPRPANWSSASWATSPPSSYPMPGC